MNWDDDEGPDPEYGVFGDTDEEKPLPAKKTIAQLKTEEEQRLERLRQQQVSTNFNSYMIELYNRSVENGRKRI